VKENSEFSNRRKNVLGAAWLWLGVLLIALACPPLRRTRHRLHQRHRERQVWRRYRRGRRGHYQHKWQFDSNDTTNSDGAYVVAGLPGATYNIVVTAKGFQKYSATKVVLDVAQKIRVDVQLTVGPLPKSLR